MYVCRRVWVHGVLCAWYGCMGIWVHGGMGAWGYVYMGIMVGIAGLKPWANIS